MLCADFVILCLGFSKKIFDAQGGVKAAVLAKAFQRWYLFRTFFYFFSRKFRTNILQAGWTAVLLTMLATPLLPSAVSLFYGVASLPCFFLAERVTSFSRMETSAMPLQSTRMLSTSIPPTTLTGPTAGMLNHSSKLLLGKEHPVPGCWACARGLVIAQVLVSRCCTNARFVVM